MTVWQGKSGYIALAKKEPFENGHPLLEPGEVHFACGDTPELAVNQLITELPSH